MPAYPIEIINFGNPSFKIHEDVIQELNSLQADFMFALPRLPYRNWAAPLDQESYRTAFIWKKLEQYRTLHKGFHPFIIAIVHGSLASDKLNSLFGSLEIERGLAVVTTKDWEESFAPPHLSVYLAYYFVRYTLSFISPQIRVHEETVGCFFDKKLYKPDIKLSMASGKICDECRVHFNDSIDPYSYESLQKLVSHIKERMSNQGGVMKKPRVFIGSSSEGINVAELIQLGLARVAECTIWSQGVFGLSTGTLESLVKACASYDYAVLVLTPDDLKTKRGKQENSPRDNVLFELGLFMGALGRERVFMVRCPDDSLDLPTDLAGVTAATYSKPIAGTLESALGPVCTRLKQAMGIG